MANPNPSPATRFKPGQSGNPKGKTPATRAAEMAAAEIAANIRHQALIRMQEMISEGQDVFELIDSNTLKLFKDSEDRAHGTPKATAEVSGPEGGAIKTEETGAGAAKLSAFIDTLAERSGTSS